ncbi:MAG TPA: transcription antitermination factor NusB [Bacilli bacterium]|nr:transcription antitermination factor NusB [Bacilli bacterium]
MSRRTSREFALQGLFQIDVVDTEVHQAITNVLEQEGPEVDVEFVRDLIAGTRDNLQQIDELIMRHAKGWDLTRMANVDRNVLRMSVYELMHHPETPSAVVLNEAVDLAKGFSTPESGRFVNGILGKILPEVEAMRPTQG